VADPALPLKSATTRALTPAATVLAVVLCVSWGFNQVIGRSHAAAGRRGMGSDHACRQSDEPGTHIEREGSPLSARHLGPCDCNFRRHLGRAGARTAFGGRDGLTALSGGLVVAFTYIAWFALIQRFSASRLSTFTFLTPLFGVAAGHFVLGEALTAAFAAAAGLVVVGLIVVNRPR
jgi:hypothetical protein